MIIFWGAATGAVAAIMLLVGGEDALSGIQNLTFVAAAPFAVVMITLCFALTRDLRNDPLMRRDVKGAEVLGQAVIVGSEQHGEDFQLDVSRSDDKPPP